MSIPTCGEVPQSTAAEAASLRITLGGPSQARSGDLYEAGMVFEAQGASSVDLVTSTPRLVIIKEGHVVGREAGDAIRPIGNIVKASKGVSASLEARGVLRGCPAEDRAAGSPDADRPLLEPGDYEVVAVVTVSGRSAHAGQPRLQLVSEALRLNVT